MANMTTGKLVSEIDTLVQIISRLKSEVIALRADIDAIREIVSRKERKHERR